ncbi:MAG: hypothetical protein DCC65_15715 [Planctomycetota bacterium]|nr:MAG: hypothetical protein DCC65_15715 [Planctomycetota bacterium]
MSSPFRPHPGPIVTPGADARWRRLAVPTLLAGLFLGACQDDPTGGLSKADLAAPGAAAARLLRLDACTDAPSAEERIREMLEAVNAERARHDLPPLRTESTLMQIADFYACRLAEGGFFSHVDPYDASTVDSRATSFGYPFMKIGENLAVGQQSVSEVLRDWMNSPGHRMNILDPAFTEIGLAVKVGVGSGPFWVQEFGRPFAEEGRDHASRTAAAKPTSSAPAGHTEALPSTSQSGDLD